MLALSLPRPRQMACCDLLFLGGMVAFCLGSSLVIHGLWVVPSVRAAIASSSVARARHIVGNLSPDLTTSAALEATGWPAGIAPTPQPAAPASEQVALGAVAPPFPDNAVSRAFDTRDWLFIASWQASRGAHGGMRAAAVAPSTHQGKQQHNSGRTRAGRPRS